MQYLTELKSRMEGAIASLKHSLNGLRTGRASASLLEPVRVNAYGSQMTISQVGSISTPEARMLVVNVWDAGLASAVAKAILESGLGLNPIAEGAVIRVPLPDLSEERRKELSKKAHEYCEAAKVAIRNIRRDGNDDCKKAEKDKSISEDEMKSRIEAIQKITDEFAKQADVVTEEKIKEIMKV